MKLVKNASCSNSVT